MTTAQKQKHVEAIRQIILANGFEEDRWGKYRRGNYKYEIARNNLKLFDKGSKWYNIWSQPMTGLPLEKVERLVKHYAKRADEIKAKEIEAGNQSVD